MHIPRQLNRTLLCVVLLVLACRPADTPTLIPPPQVERPPQAKVLSFDSDGKTADVVWIVPIETEDGRRRMHLPTFQRSLSADHGAGIAGTWTWGFGTADYPSSGGQTLEYVLHEDGRVTVTNTTHKRRPDGEYDRQTESLAEGTWNQIGEAHVKLALRGKSETLRTRREHSAD